MMPTICLGRYRDRLDHDQRQSDPILGKNYSNRAIRLYLMAYLPELCYYNRRKNCL